MARPRMVLFLILLVALVAIAAWVTYHETRIPQNREEVLNRIIELQREGRYDKAVEVVQKWMADSRRDPSYDMHDQIAFVYIAKPYKKPATRDESVRRAEENLQMALSFYKAQSRSDLSIDLFEIGGAYEILADISDKDKCRLYETARASFVQQLFLIKGDSYTAYGKTIPLEPVRRDVKKHLNSVIEKSSKAGCPASLEN